MVRKRIENPASVYVKMESGTHESLRRMAFEARCSIAEIARRLIEAGIPSSTMPPATSVAGGIVGTAKAEMS